MKIWVIGALGHWRLLKNMIVTSKKLFRIFTPLLFIIIPLRFLFSIGVPTEAYENKRVAKITITMENLPRTIRLNQDRVLSKLRTKTGDPFSQMIFDQDLKSLSEEYDRVEPSIAMQQGEVAITIKIWQKPTIRSIKWHGNDHVKTRTLQKELGIHVNTTFNREVFNKGFNKVKEYYIKKGFFESELEYKIIPFYETNEIDIEITVIEGHSGHISKICFTGLDKEDESAILSMIMTKKYNFFTSWITGMGTYHEEILEHDKLIIVNYLQNQGYANAQVHIQVKESQDGRIEIHINAIKGETFYFGNIDISDNHLLTEEQIKKVLLIHPKDKYSFQNLHDSMQKIKDLYGKDGYIETNVQYTLHLAAEEPIYDVHFRVEEGEQFRIGLIRILGNVQTNKNVILRESLLVPGEVFDSRRLKATERRLEAIGYFKTVNVYAVKPSEEYALGENYRDVIIEVEETTTGNMSLFFGASSKDDLFGGLDLAENNFDHRGLTSFWRDGLSSLRGAGEYARLRAQIGSKQQNYSAVWMDPYFKDTLWRFGFEVNYSKTRVQSKDYRVSSYGGAIFANYPFTPYWTFGTKYRFRNPIIKIYNIDSEEAKRERDNSGLVSGLGTSMGFDSIDNSFKPHRGYRSIIELELGGIRRNAEEDKIFPFFSVEYLNNYYYPIYRRGTLKFRWDLRFLCPFGQGSPDLMPLSERYFLGGVTTVRGYKPFRIGPKFTKKSKKGETDDPTGGVSSALFSVEYSHAVMRALDLFIFFDGGSVSQKRFDIRKVNMSIGVGARVELPNRMPLIFGYALPINPDSHDDVQGYFFSMGGQF
jgi:outer membrane protein insertion porin family